MESMDQSLLDDIIRRLLQVRKHQQVQLSHSEVRQLCVVSRDILLKEPSLLELKAPIKIAGDLHGQYIDLQTIFEYGGLPPNSNYLFLGNYVDCGRHSLETILLLLAFKIKYPDNLFLLRGSHECASMNGIYGFHYECERRFSIGLWEVFNDCFNCLPVAALINDKILCIHGGLSPDLHSLDQLRNIERPTDVPDSGLLCDLLWSDPSAAIQGWRVIVNCPGYTFGAEKVKEFLEKHDLDLICRGHQVVEDGYEFFAERRLVTIFSVPNLAGLFDNVGALMSVDANLRYSFQILEPEFKSLRFGRGISVPKTQPGSSSGADDAKLSFLLSGGLFRYDEEAPWIKHTEETKKKSKSGSSTRSNPSQSTPATTKYRSKSSEVKPLERTRKSNSGSNTNATNATGPVSNHPARFRDNSPVLKRAEMQKSNSPGVKLPKRMSDSNLGSSIGTSTTKLESSAGISSPGFDPAAKYRSRSPGVKRFLGAKV